MSAIITITFICSHKTWIQHLFTECHHVPGGVWLKKKKKNSHGLCMEFTAQMGTLAQNKETQKHT